MLDSHDKLVYRHNVEVEPGGHPWYDDIKIFLKDGSYPELANATNRTLSKLACCFFLNGEVLYKRSRDGLLLKCIDAFEANRIISEIHKGQCGLQMS